MDDSQELFELTEAAFKTNRIQNGRVELLVSGNIPHIDDGANPSQNAWVTGSWQFNTGPEDIDPTIGTLSADARIVGIKIAILDENRTNNAQTLRGCTGIYFSVTSGSNTVSFDTPILEKEMYPTYMYAKVDQPISGVYAVYFHKFNQEISGVTSSVYTDYNCILGDTNISFVPISYTPEKSEVISTYNNVLENTLNSFTRKVEYIPRDQRYEETTLAEIPNYFYSAIANTSGRYLGTKNGLGVKYGWNKEQVVSGAILYLSQSIGYTGSQGLHDGQGIVSKIGTNNSYYNLITFSGSVFVSGTTTGSLQSLPLDTTETIKFSPGLILDTPQMSTVTSSATSSYAYFSKAGNYPKIGDTIYNSEGEYRLVDSHIIVSEINTIFSTDGDGVVYSTSSYYSGSV